MDYSKFRSQGTKNTVSVNHKALVTRALTKYPVDFALFRELLQNSADAQSHSAKISFESLQSCKDAQDIHTCSISRLTFSNDGLPFTNDDWNRLREIASGNPNETKIGAFGVGFYSVFELTDEPLVHSGNSIMSFQYEGVQLQYFVSSTEQFQNGTLIDLPYKTEGKLPDLVKFVGFLIQSFLLVNLMEIELEVKFANKSIKLLKLSKQEISNQAQVELPPKVNTKSPNGVFNVTSLNRIGYKISIEYLNATQSAPLSLSSGWFSLGKQLVKSLSQSSGDPNDYTNTVFTIFRMNLRASVGVSSKFKAKMVETLLKPPPKETEMSLISLDSNVNLGNSLQSYVYPENYNDAKIFVGFATKQSTGFKTHLSLNQAIPTMERTAIDMSNQFVKDWNTELFYMAGILARCTYELELKISTVEDAHLVLARFKFGQSAPDALVGEIIKQGFWSCSNQTLVISSMGIKPNYEVRLPGDATKILRRVPYVTDEGLLVELKSRNLVKNVTIQEISNDLSQSPVPLSMCKDVLDWLCSKWDSLEQVHKTILLTAIKFDTGDQIIGIGDFKWYYDSALLPDKFIATHLPRSCFSEQVSKQLNTKKLTQLGIKPLSPVYWVEYIVPLVLEDAQMCGQMLKSLYKVWDYIDPAVRSSIFRSLQVPCIPTNQGLQKPEVTYTQEIKLFPNLPVIDQELDLPKRWLSLIGLRVSVDMKYVLEALNSHSLEWNNDDLIQYLHENTYALKKVDWKTLAEGHFFLAEGSKTRHRAGDLFALNDNLRELGLPIIKLDRFSHQSPEMKLLESIGLKTHPNIAELFNGKNAAASLEFYIDNFERAKYTSRQIWSMKVLPTNRGLASPAECFVDPPLQLLNYAVLEPRWASYSTKLGVAKSPKMEVVLAKIVNSPAQYLASVNDMNSIFAYLSSSINQMSSQCIQICQAKFLPIRNSDGKIEHLESPRNVVFPMVHQTVITELLGTLLPVIDVASEARPFLQYLGITDSPSITQVLEILSRDPHMVFRNAVDAESYENLLVYLATNWDTVKIPGQLIDALKKSPFLIGYRYKSKPSTSTTDDGGEDSHNEANLYGEAGLYLPSELVIVDNVIIFNQFKGRVTTAPQNDALEQFYAKFGVPTLNAMLKQTVYYGSEIHDSEQSTKLETRIKERLGLFLDNTAKQTRRRSLNFTVRLVSQLEVRLELATAKVNTKASAHFSSRNNCLSLVPGSKFEWMDVADTLVKEYLAKPDRDSVVVLELQLSSELQSLEEKGYNIEKLKQKKKFEKANVPPPPVKNQLPPSYDQSQRQQPQPQPKSQQAVQPQPQQPLTQPKQLSNDKGILPQLDSLKSLAKNTPPQLPQQLPQQLAPKQAAENPQPSQPQNGKNLLTSMFNKFQKPSSKPLDVQNVLNRGLQKSRPFNQSNLNSTEHQDAPDIAQKSCTPPLKMYNLAKIGEISSTKMQVFVDKTDPSTQPQQNEEQLSQALVLLCNVYQVNPEVVNIYRGSDTQTQAFNFNGSLFFNSSVVPKLQIGLINFYFPIFAHELAHNLVDSHGASHTYYMGAYIQNSLQNYARILP